MVTRDIEHSTESRAQRSQRPVNDPQIIGDVACHNQHIPQIRCWRNLPQPAAIISKVCVQIRDGENAHGLCDSIFDSTPYSVLSISSTTSRLNFADSGISEPSASKA